MTKTSIKHDYKHTQQKKTRKNIKILKPSVFIPITLLIAISIAIPSWQRHQKTKNTTNLAQQHAPHIQMTTSDLQISG